MESPRFGACLRHLEVGGFRLEVSPVVNKGMLHGPLTGAGPFLLGNQLLESAADGGAGPEIHDGTFAADRFPVAGSGGRTRGGRLAGRWSGRSRPRGRPGDGTGSRSRGR